MRQILSLFHEDATAERAEAFTAFLRRRAEAEGEALATAPPTAAGSGAEAGAGAGVEAGVEDALERLARAGRLSSADVEDGSEVLYTPSRQACLALADGDAGAFPAALHRKQQGAFRRSRGAIFRFPAEAGEDALEVFITDWSPCPVAGAVAVHRDHPFAAGVDEPPGAGFTGRFVRHPLTGDLLPVWIAEWVKPDFGTGAVLVNPAHDATDLAFARRVGLPVRFGLAPEGYDGSPADWLEAPVVREGVAIRGGICDGAPADEAMARYFEVLRERGLAESAEDVQAGSRPLARWSSAAGAPRPEPGPLLEAALGIARGAALSVVCPATEVTDRLLFLRLLHHDLHGRPLEAAEVVALQRADGGDDLEPEARRLALLVGAPPAQVVVVKQKLADPVRRFAKVHGQLVEAWAELEAGEAGEPAEASYPKSLGKAKASILAGDPATAWAGLAQLQKQLQKQLRGGVKAATLAGYFAVARVLAGVEAPAGSAPERVWREL